MEQKIKIQAIGAPFDVQTSSCSDYKPLTFKWTNDDCPIKVFIDGAIVPGMRYEKKPGEKKIAWVCESRSIFHVMHIPLATWAANLAEIASSYDYVFVSDKQWCDRHPNIRYCPAGSNYPWIRIPKELPEKQKLVSMVASPKQFTEGHRFRHRIAEKYKNKLDLFGGACGSQRFGILSSPWEHKEITTSPYMFSLVIENDSYETYYTEKLTDCFAAGTIPIYWGSPDISKHFNPDGIIRFTENFNISDLTKDLYFSKIDAITENHKIVQQMKMADDVLFEMINEN